MTATRTRNQTRLTLLAIVLGIVTFALVLWVAIPVGATTDNGNCQIFTDHSGHIPGSYDYAEFYEDDQLVTTVETNGEDIFVNPEGWDAGETWDTVNKCNYPPTTTTTSTIPDTTTTTEATTTTTIPETTTVPGIVEIGWSASDECQIISAEWGNEPEGIVQVNVHMRDPQFGDIEIDPFLEPGSKDATTGEGAEFILVPVVLVGYVAVPDQIVLHTEVCEEETTTTITPTTTPDDSSPPTLPFTGEEEGSRGSLVVSGLGALALGGLLLLGARKQRRIEE